MSTEPRTPCDIFEDLDRPLHKIYRGWLRWSAALVLYPIVFVLGVCYGVAVVTQDWFEDLR